MIYIIGESPLLRVHGLHGKRYPWFPYSTKSVQPVQQVVYIGVVHDVHLTGEIGGIADPKLEQFAVNFAKRLSLRNEHFKQN